MTRRRTAAWIAAVTLLAGGCGSADQPPSAADQVPRLGVVLGRVDAALVAHRYAAARQDLRTLRAAVVKARDAGELRDADATRVLDAAARLMKQLPDPSSTPTRSPTTGPSTTSSRPSASASSHPARPTSTSATPSASPTTTAPSPSTTPTPSPSAPATGSTPQVSPAAATVTPSP